VQKRSGGHYAYTYYEYLPTTGSGKHRAYR
jgi:hypothetical protein